MTFSESYFVYIDDISRGQEHFKVSFINEIDNLWLPDDFEYSSCCVIGEGACVEDFEEAPNPCHCIGLCRETSCSCMTHYGSYYKNSKLLDKALFTNSPPVIECSSFCHCSAECSNRVVQHGISHSLQVFKTTDKGFGVRSMVAIAKGSFVCEYAGEVIGPKEGEQRLKQQKMTDSNYVFVLQEKVGAKCSSITVVDPTHTGNVGRFLNHSCSPNLTVVPVRIDCMVPRLCLFAVQDIDPLEELCYSYGGISKEVGHADFLKKCLCGSEYCTGYLPYAADAFKI